MKDFLRKKGIRLGVIVLAAVIISVASARALNGAAGFFGNAVGVVRTPVHQAVAAAADWLEGIYGYLYTFDQLKAENESLKKQLAEARQQVRDAADALEENIRLRELLKFAEKHTDLTMVSSKIISWNSSNWSSTFTLSRGSDDGIALGNSVITEYGALVGQVTELGSTWATVSTVIDVDTNVGALVGDDGAAAMVVGNFALMQQGAVKLTYLAEGAQMFLGDAVLTSGMGGAFPQGLDIGTVTSIQSEAGGQIEYGIVTPSWDSSMLVQVYVVTDFDVVE
ncbi:MAG TPA: rod shape-determining protein MreC [Clostridiales bacterium]|nr:rod shape-determining protein MreC [Clostridiales bacterium]